LCVDRSGSGGFARAEIGQATFDLGEALEDLGGESAGNRPAPEIIGFYRISDERLHGHLFGHGMGDDRLDV